MPAIPSFSSPFLQLSQVTALGRPSNLMKKRKRVGSEDDQDDQYDEELSPIEDYKHGPHAPRPPKEKSNRIFSQSKLGVELSRLKAPITNVQHHTTNFVSGQPKDLSSLRQQHLTAVTTIMHRCLLEGDFIRAGRALGMLLRAELNGQPFDIRIHDRWGIGAEILLQRDAQAYKDHYEALREEVDLDAAENVGENSVRRGIEFSRTGMEKAKGYYESLILQYPYQKQKPHKLSSLHFYSAMFGLWIYSVVEQQRIALSNATNDISDQTSDEYREIIQDVETSPSPEPNVALQERVRLSILQEARKINEQLSELLHSPPFADDASLWKLKSSVSLWLGDLCVPVDSSSRFQDEHGKGSTSEEGPEDDHLDRLSVARHKRVYEDSLRVQRAHVEEGKEAYETAMALIKAREKVGVM